MRAILQTPIWKEWKMEDGSSAAVLMFPASMTEEQALESVLMDVRHLEKLGDIHNQTEGIRAIQYLVRVGERPSRPSQDAPFSQSEFA